MVKETKKLYSSEYTKNLACILILTALAMSNIVNAFRPGESKLAKKWELDQEKIKKEKEEQIKLEKEIKYNLREKPAISNLLTIYHLFSEKPVKEIEKKYQGKGYAEFKKDLAEIIIEYLKPLRQKREKLEKNPDYVKNILEESRQKAQKIASLTMEEVKKKTGLLN